MATKTLIVRPTASAYTTAFTCAPSDTSAENLYMLVNEVVADDDATSVSFTTYCVSHFIFQNFLYLFPHY